MCDGAFRGFISRAKGYSNSTVLACLCSWCEEFIEEPFKLLEQLVQQLIDYGVVLAVSVADVKIAHDFIVGEFATLLKHDGECDGNPRHDTRYACSVIGDYFRQ